MHFDFIDKRMTLWIDPLWVQPDREEIHRCSDPEIVGPGQWDSIHGMVEGYAGLGRSELYPIFIQARVATIRCPKCKKHATEELAKNPPPEKDAAAQRLWSISFHNVVNQSRNVAPMSPDDALMIRPPEGSMGKPCEKCSV